MRPCRERVEEAAKLSPRLRAKRAVVARAIGMSQRTLCRRLACEGTTYKEVLDALRRRAALERLADEESIGEASWALGYESASSFCHAVKRWTGSTPSQVRREEASNG